MERAAIELAMAFTGDHSLPLDNTTQAHLLIEVDGFQDAVEAKILSYACGGTFSEPEGGVGCGVICPG